MKSSPEVNPHEYAEQLLEDYILGTLPAGDQAWMDEHVRTCSQCRQEIGPLLRAVQALPFAAPEPDVEMTDAVWDRIAATISTPDTAASRPDPQVLVPLDFDTRLERDRASRFSSRQWLMVAALMVVSLIGGVLLAQLLPRIGGEEMQAQQIAVQFTNPDISASGELTYLPKQQVFVFTVQNMPPPPEGHVYQAWLIDASGPVSAGLVNPSTGEVASAGNRSQFQTFAITVEPGPVGNAAPTTEPIMVAPLHGSGTS